MIAVNFLWHLHQPDYRHPQDGIPVLPWVRLHAAKGYLDLLSVLQQQPSARVTVNFSGVLLDQLQAYCAGLDDGWAVLSARPAADLALPERALVWENFFSANAQTLIRPHARYAELLARYELGREHSQPAAEVAAELSDQDLVDLIVWFNLAWIGFVGQRRAEVRELIVRGRGYGHADQLAVLALQRELARQVIPGYRALAQAGRIELSVTPFNHPILPLLLDLAGEGAALADDPLPQFRHPADAEEQVRRGAVEFERAFARRPAGMWPAEGSVSDAALAVFAAHGVQWVATDQANLPRREHPRLPHLTPWRWERDGSELHVFFRDTRLSDNIGFEYARWQPALAGQHLAHMVRQLGEQSELGDPVVTIALDGENPWEAYADGGQGFLTAMFEAFAADPALECRLPGEILSGRDCPWLDHIEPGSWIYGNFDIWTRHADTRRAWRLVAKARAELEDALQLPLVHSHLLAAESSDWFWWYGDDFTSTQAWQFDELCRGHLLAAYAAAGRTPPPELYAPLAFAGPVAALRVQGLIEPVLDGRVTSFYEWRGAVRVSADGVRGSMARGIHNGAGVLWYGFSATALWLRLDCAAAWHSGLAEHGATLRVSLEHGSSSRVIELELPKAGGPARVAAAGGAAAGEIVELALPLAELAELRGRTVQLHVECRRGDGLEGRIPAGGTVPLHIITEDDAASLWAV